MKRTEWNGTHYKAQGNIVFWKSWLKEKKDFALLTIYHWPIVHWQTFTVIDALSRSVINDDPEKLTNR